MKLIHQRLNAFTIDLGIISLMHYFFTSQLIVFTRLFFFKFPVKFQFILLEKYSDLQPYLFLTVYYLYFSLFTYLTDGKTMGKSLYGLKLYTRDHSAPALWQCLLRPIIQAVSLLFLPLTIICLLMSKKALSPADIFSACYTDDEMKIKESNKTILFLIAPEKKEAA